MGPPQNQSASMLGSYRIFHPMILSLNPPRILTCHL